MQKAPPTPKGFRDIDPILAKKRRDIIGKIVPILEENGFVPIETPTIEFADTLTGKYGEEERLIYKFTDRGGRNLALRYDLTVPLARYVATNNPKLPFRRYQIGQVFRGENPQAGRWREFTQFDFDTVGSDSLEEDAKIITAAIKSVKRLGLSDVKMLVNDRSAFGSLEPKFVSAIDKLEKIGKSNVIAELQKKGMDRNQAEKYVNSFDDNKPLPNINTIFGHLENEALIKGEDFSFKATLARGLNYYTATIFELVSSKYTRGSLGGGGRYNNLIGMFSKRDIPAVGFSFGLDRLIEALDEA